MHGHAAACMSFHRFGGTQLAIRRRLGSEIRSNHLCIGSKAWLSRDVEAGISVNKAIKRLRLA